ncbi:hypothetical protein AgCh_039267 [Apium graveolens]
MSTRINIYIHHHGALDIENPSYKGKKVDIVTLDTNDFSFRDLEDFSKEFVYDSSALVYFKINGIDFSEGMKIMYDDESVKEKLFKSQLAREKFKDVSSHESNFESNELRSIDFSYEDEVSRKGFIGDNLLKNKRIKGEKLFKEGHGKEGTVKFKVGLKFLSMSEFRSTVRQYGLNERRAVYFAKNDSQRWKVICEEGCPFYIWCTRIKNSENVQIKTLEDNHNCTKPYMNKHATVKYLTGKYGDRIRKDPQWKIKDMIEVIKQEMEIEVTWIKYIRVKKVVLDGVYDSLKEHHARIRDFASEGTKGKS